MNREAIKKYKEAFDHWLMGGDILVKYGDSSIWYDHAPGWNNNIMYIINDKHAEFRKAQADGIPIQRKNEQYTGGTWVHCNKYNNFFDCYEYRIKPEEPKLKVGNWVRVVRDGHKSIPLMIGQVDLQCKRNRTVECDECSTDVVETYYVDEYILSNGSVAVADGLELWEPKKGDWCWFWDVSEETPSLRIYAGKDSNDERRYLATGRMCDTKYSWKYVEPLIGELPTELKGETNV